jgi:ribosome recycling factor
MAATTHDINDLKRRMEGSLGVLKKELSGLRTGRASANLLEPVQVDAYGTHMPLAQLATVSVPEARMLSVQVWDRSMVHAVEKAITAANLGLNPQTEGQVIRLRVPELNEERRKELVKVARGLAEEGKVALRNIRRDTMHDLRELRDAGEAGADDEHRAEEALQKITDEKVKELDGLLKAKEEEILEV